MSFFLHCQVCDLTAIEPNESDALTKWCAHSINFSEGALIIVTCPKCGCLDIGEIFDGYKKRIRAGVDANYH